MFDERKRILEENHQPGAIRSLQPAKLLMREVSARIEKVENAARDGEDRDHYSEELTKLFCQDTNKKENLRDVRAKCP